ncbi:MAG: metallophosphoesterase [Planctomycetota bacterium]
MRVIQLSDLHLGPTDHPWSGAANRTAWDNAERTAARLRAEPDADDLVIVITGDLTDAGHMNPDEFGPAAQWLRTLPGTVYVVPGNHDVGNFVSSRSTPTVSERYVAQWHEHVGPDRFAHAADGHRLLGLNAMLLGSGLPPEAEQESWLREQLDTAEAAGESVWVFQHTPLFLRGPGEVREPREHYWCPAATARDAMLALLDRPDFRGVFHGHVHRRFDHQVGGRVYRACPALSGTHSEADYFARDGSDHLHQFSELSLTNGRADVRWRDSGIETKIRFVS